MSEFGTFTGGTPIILDGKYARLTEELIYIDPSHKTYTVPADFTYDGVSIPKVVWSWVGHPFMDRYVRPAALHDWHCTHRTISSGEAHRLFYLGLRAEGTGWWRAQTMYRAVQLFGPRFSAVQ